MDKVLKEWMASCGDKGQVTEMEALKHQFKSIPGWEVEPGWEQQHRQEQEHEQMKRYWKNPPLN